MDKSPDAFRTISEVAGDLDLPQHVLRFWETRFNQIRPLKRGGGRRYYRPDDVDLLKGIRHLLYGEGYTIRGVQRILKEEGVRFVKEVWHEGAPQPPRGGRADDERDEPAEETAWQREAPEAWEPRPEPEAPVASAEASAPLDAPTWDDGRVEPTIGDDLSATDGSMDPEVRAAHVLAQRFAPRAAPPAAVPTVRVAPTFAAPRQPETPEIRPAAGIGQFLDRLRAGPAPAPVAAPEPPASSVDPSGNLSRDDIRRLQATLFELLECKRLLDQAR
ncbi:MAG: MerR family transcriptional regulator [Phyllobacteriaceae bacterium]|nr:MerR family transcriptional regulator [Phyllobacteriaceae bacterium]